MNQPATQLLRRTFMALVATAAIVGLPTAQAAQVKNADTTTVICGSYNSASVTPDGGLAIYGCSTTSTPTPTPTGGTGPGAFTLGVTGTQGNPAIGAPNPTIGMNSKFYMNLTRSGGGSNAATITVHTGGGCGPTDTPYVIAAGVNNVQALVQTPNNPTQCYTWIVPPTDGSFTLATGAPSSLSTAIVTNVVTTIAPQDLTTSTGGTTGGGGGGGGGTTPAGCPANTGVALVGSNYGAPLGFGSNDAYKLLSGQIGYQALPTLAQIQAGLGSSYSSATVQVNDTSSSPNGGTKEVWISHCPGAAPDTSVTNPPHGKCYVSSSTWGTPTGLNWFATVGPAGSAYDDSVADSQINAAAPICEAYDSNGPWYVNVRLTYSSCSWGVCGVTGQFSWSSFSP